MRKLTEKTPPHRPAAFTLIELLVAIGIIAILVGLLSPAIYNVVVKARVSEVKQEIGQLEGAIADFHLKFGMNPPSRIRLYETGNRSTGTGWYSNNAEAKRSRSVIRRLWPDFNFELDRDFDNAGGASGFWDLKGDQCLVFFLGGVWDGTKFNGFSADPRNPFKLSTTTATSIGPFMDFDAERIVTSALVTYSAPLSSFPVYADPMPGQIRPYLYISSNDGLGYNQVFTPNNPVMPTSAGTYDTDVNTPASVPPPPPAASPFDSAFKAYYLTPRALTATNDPWEPDPAAWKPETYQIISPGRDGLFGYGGPYMPDQTNRLPGFDPTNDAPDRRAEHDNITNFSDGTLVP